MDKLSIPSRYTLATCVGISLTELLIVVTVVAITVTLGAPAVLDTFRYQRVKGAAQSGYFMLQYARSMAISTGNDIAIDFVPGSNWCLGLSDSGPCDCNIADSCNVDNVEHLVNAYDYPGVYLSKLTFDDGLAVIDGRRGMAAGNAGTLELTDGEHVLRLVMSNLGRVRICAKSGNPGGYPPC